MDIIKSTEYERLSTVEGEAVPAPSNSWSTFPAQRRRGANDNNNLPKGPPADAVLISTGGNALQAVKREVLQQYSQDSATGLMAVAVPENVEPGRVLLVHPPDGSGRLIEAVVPPGALPGHSFLVQIPPLQDAGMEKKEPMLVMGVPLTEQPNAGGATPSTQVVAGRDIERNDLRLSEETHVVSDIELATAPSPQQHELERGHDTSSASRDDAPPGTILVKVPPGLAPGAKMQVQLEDGRTIEATVPPGGLKEFYLKVPPKGQNWHASPEAGFASALAAYSFV